MSTVVVVGGADETLRRRRLGQVVGRVLGDDDRTLALAEFELPEGSDSGAERSAVLAAALDAARTPPFGTGRRVVVLRAAGRLRAGEVEPLVEYLGDPLPTTALVVELGGSPPAALGKALRAAGAEEIGTERPRDATGEALTDALAEAGLTLDGEATRRVTEHLAGDAGRAPALVELLASTYGRGASLGAADVEPYLGESGAVPPYELTAAIDRGDVPGALAVLERLVGSVGMHPLQVMAVLHGHHRRILRLDDPRLGRKEDAQAALSEFEGRRVHEYPARLALEQARRLGSDGIGRAMRLLARADRDLRGATGAPPEAVMEVLVTELAMLGRRTAHARPSRAT